MNGGDPLQRGRESFARQAWGDAFAQLSRADAETPLQPEDVERLAVSAGLLGRETESTDLLTRAHQGFLAAGDPQRAARAAFWLGFTLMNRGEAAPSSGWLARAQRLLDDAHLECVERGYLFLPIARRHVMSGNAAGGYDAFAAAEAIGVRFADPSLIAIARHGMGRAAIMQGEVERGTALLDEGMVAVLAGEVSPLLAGIIYCSVLEVCHQLFDLGRAREWTAALREWCDSQPDMVPFRGHCQTNRAELLQLKGDWSAALEEAQRVQGDLPKQDHGSPVGEASYRIAELHRLRGEFGQAEEAYTRASEQGRRPYPGLALLRLAQGQVDVAATAIRRATQEGRAPWERCQLLAASVEILLAAGDVPGARAAADQLSQMANRLGTPPPLLRAILAQASGAVLLAEGDPGAALVDLQQAAALWRELEVPYEAARSGVLVARTCQALGDAEGAKLELAAARRIFQQLGAGPVLASLDSGPVQPESPGATSLTGRELEVLRLVASGRTNRAIAAQLGISEKTVARHVSNIFTKLGLSSRAALTAYGYETGLVRAST